MRDHLNNQRSDDSHPSYRAEVFRAIHGVSEIPGVSDCIEAYARVHTPSQFRSNFREADMSAAWKVDAIHTVITEATVKDRQRCDGRELRR